MHEKKRAFRRRHRVRQTQSSGRYSHDQPAFPRDFDRLRAIALASVCSLRIFAKD